MHHYLPRAHLTWDALIGEASEISTAYVKYEATPRKAILTRDGAARLLYGNSPPDAVRCSGIPRAVVVPLDTPTSYSRQVIMNGKAALPEKVRGTDVGPRFY